VFRKVRREESAEYRIPCIRGGRGKDGTVEAFRHGEERPDEFLHDKPLVKAHAIDDEYHGPATIPQPREHHFVENMRRQQRHSGTGFVVQPGHVLIGDVSGELPIAFLPLVGEGLVKTKVGVFIEVDAPLHHLLVDVHPVLPRGTVHKPVGKLIETLEILLRKLLLRNAT
jgi:hypothetical protein